MIAITSRRRARAAALFAGAALLTTSAAGLAAATPPGPAVPAAPGADHSMVVCTAPGQPALTEGGQFSDTITFEQGQAEFLPAQPADPGSAVPLEDGRCVRVDVDGSTTPLTPPVLELRR
ncbi:hypothetical protein [Nocardia sp. NPDC004415]